MSCVGILFLKGIYEHDKKSLECVTCKMIRSNYLDIISRPRAIACAKVLLRKLERMIEENGGEMIDFRETPARVIELLEVLTNNNTASQ